jgi:tripeptide aminopeptidase
VATTAESAVVSLFTELAAIPSPPGREGRVAAVVSRYLRDLALEVEEDDAGARVESDANNLLCRLEATEGGGVPLFFCAHLDTVPPQGPLEPVIEDGFVRNAGGTILGADNKSAVAAMLEAARRIVVERRPHAGVELLFTLKEEVGLQGARAFDESRLRARVGYVYDQAAAIGEVVLGAPSSIGVEATFVGRAAHSGMYPEEGRSAIVAAARAIADLRLGRLDDETTANVGTIDGGSARNIVPERCRIVAEARSHDDRKLSELVQEMLDAFTFAATSADCRVETSVVPSFRGYRFRGDELPVTLAKSALQRTGHELRFAFSGGGADANVFNERGLACLNLANGMANSHTTAEEIGVADLEGMVDVTLALVDAARAATT